MQIGGQGGDDVVERLRHRGEGVVGSKDDVVVAEHVNRCVQRIAAVSERVTPQLAGLPTWKLG
jgi:hypothetical protein